MSKADPIDIEVGARLRLLRRQRGLRQSDLARALGLTFQQVQKYENGSNRISASKLWNISRYLQVPVATLFGAVSGDNDAQTGAVPASPETVQLVAAFGRVQRPEQRRAVLDLIASLAPADPAAPAAKPQRRSHGARKRRMAPGAAADRCGR